MKKNSRKRKKKVLKQFESTRIENRVRCLYASQLDREVCQDENESYKKSYTNFHDSQRVMDVCICITVSQKCIKHAQSTKMVNENVLFNLQ